MVIIIILIILIIIIIITAKRASVDRRWDSKISPHILLISQSISRTIKTCRSLYILKVHLLQASFINLPSTRYHSVLWIPQTPRLEEQQSIGFIFQRMFQIRFTTLPLNPEVWEFFNLDNGFLVFEWEDCRKFSPRQVVERTNSWLMFSETTIMREFRKFGTAEAKLSKQDWKAPVSESLYKTVDGYGLRSFTSGSQLLFREFHPANTSDAWRSELLHCNAGLKIQDGTRRLPGDATSVVDPLRRWGTWSRNAQERMAQDTRGTMLLWEDWKSNWQKEASKQKQNHESLQNRDLRYQIKISDLCACRSDTYIVHDVAIASDYYNPDRVHDNSLEIWHSRYSRLDAEKCSSWHSEIAAKCWSIYMQLERSDVSKIV